MRFHKVMFLFLLVFMPELRAADDQVQDSGLFVELQPQFEAGEPIATLGVGWSELHHRLGLFVSRVNAGSSFSAVGIGYALHLNGALKSGPYASMFYQYRKYDPGLKVNLRYNDETEESEHDTLNHHTAHHGGGLIGYQWILGVSELYLRSGMGWQFNSDPVDGRPTVFGLGQSVRHKSTFTAELAVGYLFL